MGKHMVKHEESYEEMEGNMKGISARGFLRHFVKLHHM